MFPVLRYAVGDRVQWEESGSASQRFVDHFNKCCLGLGKARLAEDSFDTSGSGNGVMVIEGMRCDTNREEERAEELLLSFVGPAERVDRCEVNAGDDR